MPRRTRWPSTSGRAGAENLSRFRLYVRWTLQMCYQGNQSNQTEVGCNSLLKYGDKTLHETVNVLI
jgi:hypothetical protein